MLPPDGYIYMYMPQAFKNILYFLLCHIFGQKNSCHDLWSDPFKKVRNIPTTVQLTVGPCSTEPVDTLKKQRWTSCILNKAGGMGKNYIMQNNI
jgi:hypothetical protein